MATRNASLLPFVFPLLLLILASCSGTPPRSPAEPPTQSPQTPPETPPYPSHPAETGANIPVTLPASTDEGPPALPVTLDALARAQYIGDPQDAAAVEQAARLRVQTILNNPDSTLLDLLDALALAQYLGVDEDATHAKVIALIREKLLHELDESGLCKKRLLDIAATAQQLGIEDVAERALGRAKTAPDECPIATYTFETRNAEMFQVITITATGTIKENLILGRRSEDYRSYSIDGKATWTYDETYSTGCTEVKRHGTGTTPLTRPDDGEFSIFDTEGHRGEYSGHFITIEADLTETRIPICPGGDSGTNPDTSTIQMWIEGNAPNTLRIKDTRTNSWKADQNEEFTGHEIAKWDIILPTA